MIKKRDCKGPPYSCLTARDIFSDDPSTPFTSRGECEPHLPKNDTYSYKLAFRRKKEDHANVLFLHLIP